MSPVAIRRGIRRAGRRTAGLLALLVVIGTVQLHHVDPSMADMAHDGAMNTAVVSICLAMLGAVGAAAVAVAVAFLALGRWPVVRSIGPRSLCADRLAVGARARAGPPSRLLLCVDRR